MSPGQDPSPVKYFQRSLVLLEAKRTCRVATGLCSFSVLGFEQEGLLGAATQLWWEAHMDQERIASSRLPGQKVENSLTQPSSSGTFSSSRELVLLFSGLLNNWTEEKQWEVECYIYLHCLGTQTLHAEQTHRRDVTVVDSARPKAARFRYLWQMAFIAHVTRDDLEGVVSVEWLVNRMVVLWGHRHVANLHSSSWLPLLSGAWGWYSLHTLYTDLTRRGHKMPAAAWKI